MKIIKSEEGIAYNWGEVDNSLDFKNVNIIIDYDKKGNIVGFEILDYEEHKEKAQKKINNLFENKK